MVREDLSFFVLFFFSVGGGAEDRRMAGWQDAGCVRGVRWQSVPPATTTTTIEFR